jgi:hypothetical protein
MYTALLVGPIRRHVDDVIRVVDLFSSNSMAGRRTKGVVQEMGMVHEMGVVQKMGVVHEMGVVQKMGVVQEMGVVQLSPYHSHF